MRMNPDGKSVATLSPLPGVALTCAELAERWPGLEKLSPEEGNAFADDIERARANLPPIKRHGIDPGQFDSDR